MKVGTDGVLLGAWADLEKARNILDIGTGTGLIALMGAQRNPSAQIDAVEIIAEACAEARENITASPWASRIRLVQTALQDYFPAKRYDSIVCNPPFFVHSTPARDQGRTLARHSSSLPHAALIQHAARLLQPDGNFCVILPVPEGEEMIRLAAGCHLQPAHVTAVLPTPGKPAKRFLIEFKSAPQQPPVRDQLVVELSRHQYSQDYIKLTQAFYLKMES